MKTCPDCNKKYGIKDRYLMLKDKDKKFICKNCRSEYFLSKAPFYVLICISMGIYIFLHVKLGLLLKNLNLNSIVIDLLKIIISIALIYIFIFLSSFFINEKSRN